MSKIFATIKQLSAERSTFDGLTHQEAYQQSTLKPLTAAPHRSLARVLADGLKNGTLPRDAVGLLKLLSSGVDQLAGTLMNDGELLLEYLVTLLSDLNDTHLASQITSYLVSLLFADLPHPATTRISPGAQFRSADGSGNNILMPEIGAARQPYARSVQAKGSRLVQPDAGLVFDMLLNRGETFQPHPSGLSSLLFSQANLIIHGQLPALFSVKEGRC